MGKKKKKIPRRPKSVARELIPCRHFEWGRSNGKSYRGKKSGNLGYEI